MYLFLAFLAVPLIEIALFIQIGGAIGLWTTLLIVVATAVLGTYLVRSQGLRAMADLRGSFDEMQDPTEPLVHGAMIIFAGALLLTPGFFTDAVGFSLLIPGVRTWMYQAIRKRVTIHSFGPGPGQPPHRHPQDDVIDGDFRDVTPNDDQIAGSSGWTKH